MNTKIKHSFDEIMKDISESKVLKTVIYGFGILAAIFIVFQAGIIVGFHKATFGRDWDDNYSKNFGAHGPTMMPDNFPNAHGAFGKIIKVQSPTIIVEDNDNTEKVVLITSQTVIRKLRANASISDLVPDTLVVVIGSPNAQGQIEAKLIRILPAPPLDQTSPQTSAAPTLPKTTTN